MNVDSINPGFYAPIAIRPSQTEVTVQIYDAQKPDTILYEGVGEAQSRGQIMAQRVGEDVIQIAEDIARFVIEEMKTK